MEYSSNQDGSTSKFSFNGKFGFSDNEKMQVIIAEIEESKCSLCSVDLGGLDSIDSAGLGMLLLLNDAIDEQGSRLELCNPSGQVQKMLEISKFSDFITIR